MSDALKSRLASERMFTAEDMAGGAREAFYAALLWAGKEESVARAAADRFRDDALQRILTIVQAHLRSPETTIRPRKG